MLACEARPVHVCLYETIKAVASVPLNHCAYGPGFQNDPLKAVLCLHWALEEILWGRISQCGARQKLGLHCEVK